MKYTLVASLAVALLVNNVQAIKQLTTLEFHRDYEYVQSESESDDNEQWEAIELNAIHRLGNYNEEVH